MQPGITYNTERVRVWHRGVSDRRHTDSWFGHVSLDRFLNLGSVGAHNFVHLLVAEEEAKGGESAY